MDDKPDKKKGGIFFLNIDGKGQKSYPAWRYHDLYEPIIVNDTDEDAVAAKQGWHPPQEFITAVPSLKNFFHDLEDFTPRQLIIYARGEFGVEFPPQATKEMLVKAIWHLYQDAPKHRGRMVLLAQSIKMNYDETIKEIERRSQNPEQWETREVWI